MTADELKRRYVEYFRKSGKPRNSLGLGTEFEHFIIDRKSLKSHDYFGPDGIGSILRRLTPLGWNVLARENDHVLALEKGPHTITLEPGGQLELSLGVLDDVTEVADAYVGFLSEVESVLSENQAIVSLGYHPASRIQDIRFLPKKRYEIMSKHLARKGNLALHMMKGTAATQVSIDYLDEDDFIQKFRVANFLSPFLSRLFDAAPVFEGRIHDGQNPRIRVWENIDAARCGGVPGALDRRFGFEDYADYLLDTPPMFLKIGDESIVTDDQPLRRVAECFDFDQNQMELVMTLCFPDVRVKNFIEIRSPDALPFPVNMAVPAVVKGIFYDPANLAKYHRLSLNFGDRDVRELKHKLTKDLDVEQSGLSVRDMTQSLLTDAKSALSKPEGDFIHHLESYLTTPLSSFANTLKFQRQANQACFLNHCRFNPDPRAPKCLLSGKICA